MSYCSNCSNEVLWMGSASGFRWLHVKANTCWLPSRVDTCRPQPSVTFLVIVTQTSLLWQRGVFTGDQVMYHLTGSDWNFMFLSIPIFKLKHYLFLVLSLALLDCRKSERGGCQLWTRYTGSRAALITGLWVLLMGTKHNCFGNRVFSLSLSVSPTPPPPFLPPTLNIHLTTVFLLLSLTAFLFNPVLYILSPAPLVP